MRCRGCFRIGREGGEAFEEGFVEGVEESVEHLEGVGAGGGCED